MLLEPCSEWEREQKPSFFAKVVLMGALAYEACRERERHVDTRTKGRPVGDGC